MSYERRVTAKMKKMVGFGEIMLRLNPSGYLKVLQEEQFGASYTGAEANVCVSLCNWGWKCSLMTKLPRNDVARSAEMQMHKYNISTDDVVYGGDRLGVYFLEKGASQRPSKVTYDRKYSSIATAKREDFDWARILEGATNFHFTGITPALGGELPEICMDACVEAKKRGILISLDLNYRSTLWDEDTAKKTMSKLAKYADIIIGNEEDAQKVLGIQTVEFKAEHGIPKDEEYALTAQRIVEEYGCKSVAFSLRKSISASDNLWKGMFYTDGQAYFSREYALRLVDRVGGGDSFAAGIIYGVSEGFDPQRTIDFAVAASCLKQTIEKDFNLSSLADVYTLMDGNGSGRVVR